jgi:HK97 family phage major capsid protein
MPSLKELRERASEVHQQMCEVRDAYNERKAAGKTGAELWPKEAREGWEKLNAEHESLRAQIAEEKRSGDLDAAIADMERESREQPPPGDGQPPVPPAGENRQRPGQDDRRGQAAGNGGQRPDPQAEIETRDLALQAWFGRRHAQCRSERHLQAAQHCGLDLGADELVIDLYDSRQFRAAQHQLRTIHPSMLEQRALSGHVGGSGAFLIGSTLVSAMEINMLAFGGVEQVADIIVTQSGEEMSWPTADDTSNEGEMLGENTETNDDEDPTFAAVRWNAYEFSSKAVKVPVRLLEDAPQTFAQSLGEMLGERLGRAKNRKFTSGTGIGQPKGIVVCASSGKTAASATAITADEIIELEHSVDPAYRSQPGTGFMAHDSILMQIRLLKHGDGTYVWQSGLIQGMPDRLLNRPVTPNQHMDSALAANNKVLLFGQLSKYKVRRVRQVVILRLKERGAEKRQEWFLAFQRADGNLLDAGTAPVKYLQMAA